MSQSLPDPNPPDRSSPESLAGSAVYRPTAPHVSCTVDNCPTCREAEAHPRARRLSPQSARTVWCVTCNAVPDIGPINHLVDGPDHVIVEAIGELFLWTSGPPAQRHGDRVALLDAIESVVGYQPRLISDIAAAVANVQDPR